MKQLLFVFFIFRNYLCGYSTPRTESRGNFHPSRFASRSQIIQDIVCQSLVKNAFIAVALHVEFQALQLDAEFVRTVFDDNFAEIWLARARTNAGEFRTSYGDTVIPLKTRIIKYIYLERFVHCVTPRKKLLVHYNKY